MWAQTQATDKTGFQEAQMLLAAHFYIVIPIFSPVSSSTVLSQELGLFLPNFSHLKFRHLSFTVSLGVLYEVKSSSQALPERSSIYLRHFLRRWDLLSRGACFSPSTDCIRSAGS